MESENLISNKSVNYKISTQLMESYRKVSKIELGSVPKAVTRSDGAMEFYMLRTDNYIERFYPDSLSETGFSSQKLPLTGGNFEVVVDSSGSTIIIAGNLDELYYIKETTPCSGEFCPPTAIKVDKPDNSQMIFNTFVGVYNDQIWIAALMETDTTEKTGSRTLLYGKWNNDYTHLTNSGFTISGANGTWCKRSGVAPYLVVSGNSIVGVNGLNNEIKCFPSTPSGISHISSVYDSVTQKDILYALADNGSCYYTYSSESGEGWDTHTLKGEISKLVLESDTIGNIWVNSLTKGGDLYHGTYPQSEEDDGDLFLIKSGVKDIATNYNTGGSPSVVCINEQGLSLDLLLYENCSGMWNEQVIPISCDDIYTAPSYCSEITLLDQYKAPTPMLDIWLWSNEYARVVVNENVIILDDKKVKLQTDVLGRINICQLTDSLSVPNIFISTTEDGAQDSTFVLNHYDVARTKLSGLSAEDLKCATKEDGSYLLAEKYRTPEITDSLAKALGQCVELIPNNAVTNGALYRANLLGANSQFNAGRLTFAENAGDTHWSISVLPEGGVEFKNHSLEDVNMLMSEMNGVGSLKKFFKHIGSFVKAVANKAVKVSKIIVSKVKNVVTTVIQYVEDGVSKLFQHIVETAQEVFAVAEAVFHQVEVAFKDLFNWLGFIFNWDDILRSKEALKHVTNEYFTLAVELTGIVANYLTTKIDGLGIKIESAIDSVIEKLDSNASIGSYMNNSSSKQMPTRYEDATSHNFLFNQLLYNDTTNASAQTNGCCGLALTLSVENQSAYDLFLEKLDDFAQTLMAEDEFKKALEYFRNMLSSPSNLFNNALCGILELMKGLVHIALTGVEIIMTRVLSLVEGGIQLLQELLNAEINIPFISHLYKKISGNNLSIIDVSSLILSIPYTALYKVIYKEAPYKDEVELDEFKQSFTAKFIISRINGKSRSNVALSNSTDEKLYRKSAIISVVAAPIYYLTTAYLDCKDILKKPVHLEEEELYSSDTTDFLLSAFGLIVETVWDIASGIMLFINKFKIINAINWGFVAFGCVIDIISIATDVKKRRLSDNAGETMKIVTFLYGVLVLGIGFGTWSSCDMSKKEDRIGFASTIIPAGTIVAKAGLLDRIKVATEGYSVIAVSVLDLAVAITEPFLLYYSTLSDNSEEDKNQILLT